MTINIASRIALLISLSAASTGAALAKPGPALICDTDGKCRAAALAQAPERPAAAAVRKAGPVRVVAPTPSAGAVAAVPAECRPNPRNPGLEQAVIRSGKTGKTACVSSAERSTFQSYVDDVEREGGIILAMNGVRRERCAPPRYKHGCGYALDVCQTSRGVVMPSCRLPSRHRLIALAARHGLTEGGQWCDGDRGHAEAGASVGPCGATRTARAGVFHVKHSARRTAAVKRPGIAPRRPSVARPGSGLPKAGRLAEAPRGRY